MNPDQNKPRILILGGTGFVGRNLVEYLIENDFVSKVRIVDKVPPQTAWFNKQHQEVFADPRVEFKSANLINPTSCESAFHCSNSEVFNYVVNLAAETRIGLSEAVYRDGVLKVSVNCAKEAERRNVQRYVELSCGHLFSNGKKANKETDKASPQTALSRSKLAAEEELSKTTLDYIIIRPSVVYGVGDRHEMTPRLLIGAIYKYLGEKMELFWDKDMKINTIHVRDLCRAVWHLLQHGKSREIYHLVDKGDTTLGKLCDLISDIFNINHDYLGNFLSNLANKNDLSSIVEEINEKHLGPWAEMCAREGITNTPLTPYIKSDMLLRKHVFLDGSKLERSGFVISIPEINKELLIQVLQDFANMGLFPPSLVF